MQSLDKLKDMMKYSNTEIINKNADEVHNNKTQQLNDYLLVF